MTQISQAFILAAGRGSRMQHLTDNLPKPLITVANKCLIDYNIEHLQQHGIKKCVVNLCYKGEMIRDHLLEQYPDMNFIFSEEKDALETGGGIKNALPLMDNAPFFVINSDALWSDSHTQTALLTEMATAWQNFSGDIMLMLQPLPTAYGVGKNGDYWLDEQNLPQRRTTAEQSAPYLYGGVLICHPRAFDAEPNGHYSLIRVFDRLQQEKNLGGYIHQGYWFHVGDPQAKIIAEQLFAANL